VGRSSNEGRSPWANLSCFWQPICLFFFKSFCAISRVGIGDVKEGNQIVAVHNGQVFRFYEVVHMFERTAPGIPAKKTEFTNESLVQGCGQNKNRREIYLPAGCWT
jgi:hypothetical protein